MKTASYLKSSLKSEFVVNLVARALFNERAIDIRYCEVNAAQQDFNGIPAYKAMAQMALRRKFGRFYALFILISPWVVVGTFPYHWISAALGGICRRRRSGRQSTCRIFATSRQNFNLINSALDADESMSALRRREQSSSCFRLGREIGFVAVMRSVFAHIRLIFMLLGFPAIMRREMLLHARDSFSLIMIAFDVSDGSDVVVTDDHYQRWSYIFSHLVRDFRIVQHGVLDTEIKFPNSYGKVHKLYLRDPDFLEQALCFYQVESSQLFSPKTEFIQNEFSGEAILLASSFPAIDLEIELLTAIRARCRIPVIVKFHPAHTYDGRRGKLAALADMVFEGNGNPACRIFVSYNSFMELNYKQGGVRTVSISQLGVDQACLQILEFAKE